MAVESRQFENRWERVQAVLADHESWYRRVRISRLGTPEVGAEEIAQIEPSIREAVRLYFEGSEPQRAVVRNFFGTTDRCLLHLNVQIGRLAATFERVPTEEGLELALAAVSLENNRWDYRDTYLLLGDLYLKAVRSGFDPLPALRRVAALSGGEPVYKAQGSMRSFLGRFTESAFFRESVEPELGTLRRDS